MLCKRECVAEFDSHLIRIMYTQRRRYNDSVISKSKFNFKTNKENSKLTQCNTAHF